MYSIAERLVEKRYPFLSQAKKFVLVHAIANDGLVLADTLMRLDELDGRMLGVPKKLKEAADELVEQEFLEVRIYSNRTGWTLLTYRLKERVTN